MMLKWKDKKDLAILSTIHDDSMVNVVSRRGVKTKNTMVVVDFNANMGAVDLKDGLLCRYSTARNKMKRFYMKIFQHL